MVPNTRPAKLPSGWLKRLDTVTIHTPVERLRIGGPMYAPRLEWVR